MTRKTAGVVFSMIAFLLAQAACQPRPAGVSHESHASGCCSGQDARVSLPDGTPETQEVPEDEPWSLSGEYFEGCPCGIPCPCIFYEKSDVEQCTVMNNYYIEEGTYKGTNLKGRNIVYVAFPRSRQMYEGKIDGVIYLDASTPEADRPALEELARKVFDGKWYNEIFAVKYVPMQRTATASERWLVIPDIMDLKVKALEGRDHKVQRIENNGMIGTVIIAPSIVNKYHDIGKTWSYEKRSGFIAPFKVDSKDPDHVHIGFEK